MKKNKRNIGEEILTGLRDIRAGKGKRICIEAPEDIIEIRTHLHLSQSAFAALMGVSARTLQEWKQGRRKPSGPALSL